MSANCINCVKNPRTGPDLLCDECREPSSLAAMAGSAKNMEAQNQETGWLRKVLDDAKASKNRTAEDEIIKAIDALCDDANSLRYHGMVNEKARLREVRILLVKLRGVIWPNS